MKHLGDISKIHGAHIEPVDLITLGSPCQDLSVAGKRAGLKHEANGDDKTTRSGLFMEAVRIIKEMREATNGKYPRFALWENVPGAFSSNKGEDFRVVLEEIIKIIEPEASMPAVPKAGWAYADCYSGHGWSLAYRVLDAQYWGVPQRRRRIYLVADFGGECAKEILFKHEGLRGDFTEGRVPWQGIAADAEGGIGTKSPAAWGLTTKGNGDAFLSKERHTSLSTGGGQAGQGYPAAVIAMATHHAAAYGISSYDSNAMKSANPHSGIYKAETSRTLDLNGGNPACNQGGIAIVEPVVQLASGAEVSGCLMASRFNKLGAQEMFSGDYTVIEKQPRTAYCMETFHCATREETAQTLKARDWKDPHVVAYGVDCRNMNEYANLYPTLQAKPNGGQSLNYSGAVRYHYIVRRLTPTECARLQGFADRWGNIDQKTDFPDEEYQFWHEVRNTHAAINGKTVKGYTKKQMLSWYNKLHSDSAEYKMWGNGIALPTALYCMQGIAAALEKEAA